MSNLTISAKATSVKSLGGLPQKVDLIYTVKLGRSILGNIKAELNTGLPNGELTIDLGEATVGKKYQNDEDQAGLISLIKGAAKATPFSTLKNLGLEAAIERVESTRIF